MPSDRDTAPAAVEVDRLQSLIKSAAATTALLMEENKSARAKVALLVERAIAVEAERDALRDRVKVLEEALRPFAHVAQSFPFQPGTNERRERNKVDGIVWSYRDGDTDYRLHVPDFRRARAALSQNRTEGGTDGK